MNDKINNNPKWARQKAALKKVQLSFSLLPEIDQALRVEAAMQGDSPSNLIRKFFELDAKATPRPRLGVSLSDDELKLLGKKLGVDPNNRAELVKRATEQLQLHYRENID